MPPSAQPSTGAETKVATLSTESIASTSQPAVVSAHCANCSAPLASDQRYCLECGQRRLPMSSVLATPPPMVAAAAPPLAAPLSVPAEALPPRNATLTLIAAVGVLLLAMGVGVLIGRSSASRQSAAPAPVISVASPGPGTGPAQAGEASFAGDWPGSTKGYTVQLQTLPAAGTSVSAVEAAKAAATGKGAKAVGALKSDEYSSLTAGSYVIYSGVFHRRSEAEKALGSLKKSFPGARVVEVSNGAAGSSAERAAAGRGGNGSSLAKPAPPSVLESLKGAKGKSYVEKSKNLPNVVETG